MFWWPPQTVGEVLQSQGSLVMLESSHRPLPIPGYSKKCFLRQGHCNTAGLGTRGYLGGSLTPCGFWLYSK